jgi:hypothetical protein
MSIWKAVKVNRCCSSTASEQTGDNFTPVARFLTPHYRVIIPDHIGFALEQRIYDADVAYPVEPHIAGLPAPTLIVWGKEDRSHNVAAAVSFCPTPAICR